MGQGSQSHSVKNLWPENLPMLFAAFSASYGIGLLALLGLPFMFGATIDGLNLSESQAGLLGTVEFLAIMATSLGAAPFMSVAPRKVIAFIGVVIAIAGNGLSVFSPDLTYETAMVFRAIAGLGCGLSLAVGNATVSNAKDPEKMAAHMAVLFVALMAATMLLFSWAGANWGYQGVYGALAGVMLLLSPFLLGLPQHAASESAGAAHGDGSVGLFSFASISILLAMMIFALRDMSGWAFVERIGMGVGYAPAEVGQLLSLQALVGISGPLIASFIGSRFGLSLPLIVGILASGAVYFMMLLIPDSRQVYTISAMFIGGTYFFALSYLTALAAELDSKGRIVAASGGFMSLGIGLGPLFGGYLVQHYGYEVASWAIFVMVILTLVFALLAVRALKPKAGAFSPHSTQKKTELSAAVAVPAIEGDEHVRYEFMSRKTSPFTADLGRGLLLDGRWVDGSAGMFDVLSPHSGEVIHSMGKCSPADAQRAIASSDRAFHEWKDYPVTERVKFLRRITQLIVENGEAISQMVCDEIGKPIKDAREEVFEYAAPSYAKAAEEALRHRGLTFPSTQEPTNNKKLVQFFRPLGVVAVITPYNFPVDIASIALAHCIAAGNTVVWKPSEYAAGACAMIAEMFIQAGLPPGVINVVQGHGDVGAELVTSDDVKGVFFTGSTKTGTWIAREAALKPQLLELGGDGPFIIMPDADIDAAVEAAINGCFYYAGQVCTSGERLLVHADVYDEFVRKFKARAKKLVIGDPRNEDTDMGPLCNKTTFDRCVRHVEDAFKKGADIVQVGKQQGNYFPATIMTNVSSDMEIIKEETFGPVAPIIKIHSAQEAIDIAHSTGLGLIASLWTRDLATAFRVAEALPHGTVNVNETSNYWDQLAPFGGTGNSGVGRELSQWFMNTFTESKLIVFDLGDGERVVGRPKAEGGWRG